MEAAGAVPLARIAEVEAGAEADRFRKYSFWLAICLQSRQRSSLRQEQPDRQDSPKMRTTPTVIPGARAETAILRSVACSSCEQTAVKLAEAERQRRVAQAEPPAALACSLRQPVARAELLVPELTAPLRRQHLAEVEVEGESMPLTRRPLAEPAECRTPTKVPPLQLAVLAEVPADPVTHTWATSAAWLVAAEAEAEAMRPVSAVPVVSEWIQEAEEAEEGRA